MDDKINKLIEKWKKTNILGLYADNREQALLKVLELIPLSASVGISGSQTLDQLSAVAELQARGNKVFNQYQPGLSRQESLKLRELGAQADFYLSSANAISENGELVFFSAWGQRVAGIASAKNVIIIAGINKITPNLEEAIERARAYVTPLNCKRLNFNTPCLADGICRQSVCLFPEYRRMCCQVLVIEAETTPERLKVVLVGESLGF